MVETVGADDLLVQLATYNTNLQGKQGVPQDLVDWLAPTLQVSTFLSRSPRASDIIAVGFQELLPLHLGLSGLSTAVIDHRAAHILSELESHAPNKEKYVLVSKIVNAGLALLIYARDDTVARTVCDVQTSWTGCGPMFMGNKGAVAVRFRIPGESNDSGQTFTFVCAHLTAHAHLLDRRIDDWNHIVSSLLFPPLEGSDTPSTLYDTSNLFLLGDLNFRVDPPDGHPLHDFHLKDIPVARTIEPEETRSALKEFDQLLVEQRKGNTLIGLREGDFWKFKCTYKYELGEVDTYNTKRVPSWTDRILYVSHLDAADTQVTSHIKNLLYTHVPGYTTSDHKPVVAVLAVPQRPTPSSSIPLIHLPSNYTPTIDSKANLKRYTGLAVDRVIGIVWWLFTIIGAGSAVVGLFNFFVGFGAWRWWRTPTNV
ncbi:inositol polyphosphate phosphatase [Cylindrobasidium torrendii FP15055 ss-10]|uniref:Inositol polyphosphate phosphatase n=1 Tax=Cylindrobasidium torrendii FP15055 ss-10 TaxID=1314674 RepID=A0A0D7BNP7_9AGAR|nr:inositol polyphosphate phosphatase [Cylindrobasidium torrendii FP15055 ss-10]